ncbi:MAG: MlaD family protein [Gemmatimonadota bacterium]|nr:MlaD family protein [Gemmatimonadota bacterium]
MSLSDAEVLQAVPPTRRAYELRVGLFVITGIVGFFTVLFLMTSPATFRGRYMVTTLVEDAQGIRKGDPVQMRGVNVGRVDDFRLERGGVLLTLEIEGEWEIPRDSRSELISNGLLGGLTVAIVPGSSTESLQPFDEIPGAIVPGIFASAGGLTEDAGVALERVQALLSESTVHDIGTSVASLREVLGDLAQITEGQADEVRALTASLNRSAGNVEEITGSVELSSTLQAADTAMVRLSRTSEALEAATASLNVVLARMERGEGTLGRLSTSDSLYVSMHSATESLRLLLDDIRARPGRYIKLEVF